MTLKLSPGVFSTAYCVGYALAFRWNLPLFRYFPVPHRWLWRATDDVVRLGPVIVWYGLVASASLIAITATVLAAAAAALADDKLPRSRVQEWLWLAPWSAAIYCAYLLRPLFY